MSEPLNRQARWTHRCGEVGEWIDYGAVTFAQAASQHADAYGLAKMDIQVRCTSSPDDIRTIPVRRVVSYKCGLRGAGSNAD